MKSPSNKKLKGSGSKISLYSKYKRNQSHHLTYNDIEEEVSNINKTHDDNELEMDQLNNISSSF